MKRNTSITLSREVLAGIDRLAGSRQSRSTFIEAVLRRFLTSLAPAELEARDRERINRASDRLNAEAAEVRGYFTNGM
jgi:metal-responsive CopG/Arc/MetJ family transcriptional regulator